MENQLPCDDSNQELNLIDCLDSSIVISQTSSKEPKLFSCNYCQRSFYSSQALGGHQNAHKRERTLAKRGQQRLFSSSASAFAHPYGGFSSYNNNMRSLGIQAHSMSHHKLISSYNNGFGGHQYGQINWSRLALHQQPAIAKLSSMENFHHHLQNHQMMMMAPSVDSPSTNMGRIQEGEEQQKLDLSLKL